MKKGHKLELHFHNRLDMNYKKVKEFVRGILEISLRKFVKDEKWKLEIWLDNESKGDLPEISCAMALKRPRRNTLYAKKSASSLYSASKSTLDVLLKNLRREKNNHHRPSMVTFAS